MMKVHTLVLGSLQTNCYIIYDEGASACAVVDPAASPERILEHAGKLGLTVDGILLTHGHFDHVGAVESLRRETGCALYMHEGDYHYPKNPMTDYLYPLHDKELGEVTFCRDGDEILAGGVTFTVHATPGHSQGSVCYRCAGALFSGDTLFAGGCGRTDLPGGDWATIRMSLADLTDLEDGLNVYPGHGESTTLAEEKQYNPYMK